MTLQAIIHAMRRDYIAISLYVYLAAVLSYQWFDLPVVLEDKSWLFIAATAGSTQLGCVVSAVSRFWKDDLDGGAIEQFGLAVSLIGWTLYLWAFAQLLPEVWFGLALASVFFVCFTAQWLGIRHWRNRLRRIAVESNG